MLINSVGQELEFSKVVVSHTEYKYHQLVRCKSVLGKKLAEDHLHTCCIQYIKISRQRHLYWSMLSMHLFRSIGMHLCITIIPPS